MFPLEADHIALEWDDEVEGHKHKIKRSELQIYIYI